MEYLRDPAGHAAWTMRAGARCGNAPLLFPTDGYVGYVWGSTFQPLHPHQGIDIFGDQPLGRTPVVSAGDGYLTRLPGWKSAVIVRIPSDPLHPSREIWLYYAHMADPEGNSFIDAAWPPGTSGKPVKAGEVLGYQGNYTGDPQSPSGIHLHFSIVRGDGRGGWLNELEIGNTLDPSPYFGLPLNAGESASGAPACG
jgi:murein DD-endopeptidase MepM/ murein hydrolase activator NlpD